MILARCRLSYDFASLLSADFEGLARDLVGKMLDVRFCGQRALAVRNGLDRLVDESARRSKAA